MPESKDGHQTKSKLDMEKFTTLNGLPKYVNLKEATTVLSPKVLLSINIITRLHLLFQCNMLPEMESHWAAIKAMCIGTMF